MSPKGKLLIIGGAEDLGDSPSHHPEEKRFEILKELLPTSRKHRVELITTGTKMQARVQHLYTKAFARMGYMNPGFIPIENKMQAKYKKYRERIENASAVFFTGGDQFRISTILGGTHIVDLIKQRYEEDASFLVAGTSAGAMVMSSIMISEGGTKEALFAYDIKTSSGLGLLKDCIIDTHFIKRGRFSRLAHAIIINPDQLGIGLGEDTALVIKNGSEAECRGSGMVVIIDGKNIRQTNVSEVSASEAVFVENLKVHLLIKGCRFSIKTRKLYSPAISKG